MNFGIRKDDALDLVNLNGLVYESSKSRLFTGLVCVPFIDFLSDQKTGRSKMVNHEFLSIFFDTYEDEWNECEEGEVPRGMRGFNFENYVCHFRFKQGLRHGVSEEIFLCNSQISGGYLLSIRISFWEGKPLNISLHDPDDGVEIASADLEKDNLSRTDERYYDLSEAIEFIHKFVDKDQHRIQRQK